MTWDEAAKQSKLRRAVAPISIEHGGRKILAEIYKPLNKDPYICYYHTYIMIRKATAKEVDEIDKQGLWKPW